MHKTIDVPTEAGPGRLLIDAPRSPRAVLLLGHGAGGGITSFDLDALAHGLPSAGIAVARFEQPWVVAGRKIAGPPKTLDAAWRAMLPLIHTRWKNAPLIVGGRSAGARVACRYAANLTGERDPLGVIALAYPLHPPGKPEKSRRDELSAVPLPVLVIQGEKDTFGTPSELASALKGNAGARELVAVPRVGHPFRPGKREDPSVTAGLIVDAAVRFIDGMV